MKKSLDNVTRIKLMWLYLPALGSVIALQRKKWYGWKTVSWIYPSIMRDVTLQRTIDWLEWKDKKDNTRIDTDYVIGKRLMTET